LAVFAFNSEEKNQKMEIKDHDDRVVPAHSFKFAAELQEKHAGESPVLIRIETNAGHGAGKPTDKIIDGIADKYAFAWYNMDLIPMNDDM